MRFFSLAAVVASGAAIASSIIPDTNAYGHCDDGAHDRLVKIFFTGLKNLNRWGASQTSGLLQIYPALANATLQGQTTIKATLSNVHIAHGLSNPERAMLSQLLELKAPVDMAAAVDLARLLHDNSFVSKAIAAHWNDFEALQPGLARAVELGDVALTKSFLLNYRTRFETPFHTMNPHAPQAEQVSCLDYALKREKEAPTEALRANFTEIAKMLHEGQVSSFTSYDSSTKYCRPVATKP